MTEIDKMYENANIKKIHKYQREIDNGDPRFTGISHSNSYIVYPDFTTDKQIELIKWLARKDYGNYAESLLISIRDGYNYLSVGITTDFGSECFYEDFTFNNKQFDEAIAGLINKLWQSLTDQKKEEIRNILK